MNSIRKVMLVALIGLMSLVMILAAGFSYRVGLQEAGEMFDAKLAHSARVLMSLVDDPINDLARQANGAPVVVEVWHGEAQGVGEALVFPGGHAYETKLAFQVRDASGRLLLRSDSGPTAPLAPLAGGYADNRIDGQGWRTFTLRSPGGYWYQSGELEDIRAELAREVALGILIPLMLALPLLALLVWLVVAWATRSLERASLEIEQRDPDRLTPIGIERVPREIQGIVRAVNGLLQRLDQTLSRERRFTADAAHELRTPIAALRVHADNLRTARGEIEREESQRHLEASVRRIERLVAQLLELSRAEPGASSAAKVRFNLRASIERHVAEYRRLAQSRNVKIALSGDAIEVLGDEFAIDALVRNLIDNAVRYAPDGGRVLVTLQRSGEDAELRVEDSGPGIPVEVREKVFERFHREIGSGVEGSGLGLSIVRQVLDSHAGDVHLDDSPQLGGLMAIVRLPAVGDRR